MASRSVSVCVIKCREREPWALDPGATNWPRWPPILPRSRTAFRLSRVGSWCRCCYTVRRAVSRDSRERREPHRLTGQQHGPWGAWLCPADAHCQCRPPLSVRASSPRSSGARTSFTQSLTGPLIFSSRSAPPASSRVNSLNRPSWCYPSCSPSLLPRALRWR
jgi:hypothetical protein